MRIGEKFMCVMLCCAIALPIRDIDPFAKTRRRLCEYVSLLEVEFGEIYSSRHKTHALESFISWKYKKKDCSNDQNLICNVECFLNSLNVCDFDDAKQFKRRTQQRVGKDGKLQRMAFLYTVTRTLMRNLSSREQVMLLGICNGRFQRASEAFQSLFQGISKAF